MVYSDYEIIVLLVRLWYFSIKTSIATRQENKSKWITSVVYSISHSLLLGLFLSTTEYKLKPNLI